ncbi:MAG: DUF6265 family protein [Bacteroidales bacterium]|nr:DUF6265 family protein [Bacteroidales bacterium]
MKLSANFLKYGRIITYYHLAVILLIFQSCFNSDEENKELRSGQTDLAWLNGSWISADQSYHEIWTNVNDTLIAGIGYTVEDNDTLFSETLQIINSTINTYYLATIPDQNFGMPVRFDYISYDTGKIIFENKIHDFPNRIEYRKITDSTIKITVSGTNNDKKINLVMKKEQTF